MSRRQRVSNVAALLQQQDAPVAARPASQDSDVADDGVTSVGIPLDSRTRADMEGRFGQSLEKVRIHADGLAAASAQALRASAYTLGQHIVFASGRYDPQTVPGRRLLAHELAHTVQQRDATTVPGPVPLSRSRDAAEQQAHHAAADAMKRRPVRLRAQPAMVMREDKGTMRDFVREVRSGIQYQDRFIKLNGREMGNLLAVLEVEPGGVQPLIDNFDLATGVDRPRLGVALHAVSLKGKIGHEVFAAAWGVVLGGLPADQKQLVLQYLGAPPITTPQATPPTPSTTSPPVSVGNFKTRSYSMSTTDVTLVRGREKTVAKGKGKNKDKDIVTAGRNEIKESPQHFTAEIVKLAALPDTWFDSFTRISFLGFTVSDIHTSLATHLRTVEQKFVEQYGGDKKDPKIAGVALGLKQDVGGGRHAPTGTAISMHLFGLAIDVNYATNPWVMDDPDSKSGKNENVILKRASLLVDGKETGFTPNTMDYDAVAALNQSIKTYFSYLDNKIALEAKLKTATGFWAGKSADDATKQVQADFDQLAVYWERTGATAKDAIKSGGFLDLKKAFVEGMGLDWGGKYGDMMHFDMRNKGDGAKIDSARAKYKTLKVAEAEKKYAEEHP